MEDFEGNRIIKDTVARLRILDDEKYIFMLADVLMHRIHENAVAVTDKVCGTEKLAKFTGNKRKSWYVLCTDEAEYERGVKANEVHGEAVTMPIRDILTVALEDEDCAGVMINPYGDSRKVYKDTIAMLFMVYKKQYYED